MNEITKEGMKAMTRKELADYAGVTTTTLRAWMKPHRELLYGMGMRPNCILPPNVVEWLCTKYCIRTE